jgi:cation diffusion facilitator family transporter
MRHESRLAIVASVGANVAIAISKFVAATLTGSSAMLAEAVHSSVNSMDGTLLYLGHRRARRPPDDAHPLGHGKELYFWSLIVAVLFFGLGGGVSIYEGIQHVASRRPIESPLASYIVLAISFAFDSSSFVIAARQFNRARRGRPLLRALRDTKDPTLPTLVMEDAADLTGICLAFLGVLLSSRFGLRWADGAASIAIGLVMAALAVFLMIESHGLLIGESAPQELRAVVRRLAAHADRVVAVDRPVTLQLGVDSVLVGIDVAFEPEATARDIARAVEKLEEGIKRERPDVSFVYIEARSLRRCGAEPGDPPELGAE